MFRVRIKSSKKILLAVLGSVLLIFIIFGFYKIPFSTFDDIESKSITFDYFFAVKPDSCENLVTSEIEYLYYDNSPKNQNNKFGLYVYAENKDFIKLAANLVNSNGGDWGYVLIPFNMSDRDSTKWREVFELLYEKRLIPIIQLNAVDINDYKNQTKDAAYFLNSFLWPVKERYISVYNEPNSSDFWFGYVDASEYATVLDFTIDTFKKENPNFFMLNGALNASAPESNEYSDSFNFMYQMNKAIPGIFEKLDGWASHSYPQPNFSGSPEGFGRWSVRAYASELDYLKDFLAVNKDLPVFITETGWAHAGGENYNSSYFTSEEIGKFFEIAYKNVWLPDERVIAVTPFTIWYDPPFDNFAWVNKDKVPYKQYEMVKSLNKVAGTPNSLVTGKVMPSVDMNCSND